MEEPIIKMSESYIAESGGINEAISLSTLTFGLIWGNFWIFLISAIAAMIFDSQFIIIQRYNRPRIVKALAREKKKDGKKEKEGINLKK